MRESYFLKPDSPPLCIPFNCIACIARHDKIVHHTCIADHYFLSFDPLDNNHHHYFLAFELSDNTQYLIIRLYSLPIFAVLTWAGQGHRPPAVLQQFTRWLFFSVKLLWFFCTNFCQTLVILFISSQPYNYSALLNPPSCRPDRPSRRPRLGHPEATGSKKLGGLAGKDKKEEQRLARPRDSGFLIGHFFMVGNMKWTEDLSWVKPRLTECSSGTWMRPSSSSTPCSPEPLQQSKHSWMIHNKHSIIMVVIGN